MGYARILSVAAVGITLLGACSHSRGIDSDVALTSAAGERTANAAASVLGDINASHEGYEKHLLALATLEGSSKASSDAREMIDKQLDKARKSFTARRIFLRDLESAYAAFGELETGGAADDFSASAAKLAGSLQQYAGVLGKGGAVSGAAAKLGALAGKAYAGKKIQKASIALGDAVAQGSALLRAERGLYLALQQEFARTEGEATLALWRAGMLSSAGLTRYVPLLPGFIPSSDQDWTAKACPGRGSCTARNLTYAFADRAMEERIKHEANALKATLKAFRALENAHNDIAAGRPVESYGLAAAVHQLRDIEEAGYEDLPLAGGPLTGDKGGLIERLKARF